MADQWGRVIAGSAALAVLWIAVYWAWEPSPPPITYGAAPDSADAAGPGQPADVAQPDPARATPDVVPPAPRPQPKSTQVPKAVAPEFTMYRVRPGDTLASISQKFYNNDKHGPAIAKANPFKDPQRLKAGDELRIPRDVDNIQGKDAMVEVPVAPDPAPAPPPKAADKTYVVKSGDTLSDISKKHYGTVKHADLIFEANRKLLNSPDDIREGQTLVIPPKPDAGSKTASGDGRP